jgi:hypothetical protein
MQNATNQDGLVSIESPIDELGSIVSEVISLIEHVRAGITAIEAEIVREQLCSNRDDATNAIVLADVTPRYARMRYARASAALNACRASLCTTLNVLAGKRLSRRVILLSPAFPRQRWREVAANDSEICETNLATPR